MLLVMQSADISSVGQHRITASSLAIKSAMRMDSPHLLNSNELQDDQVNVIVGPEWPEDMEVFTHTHKFQDWLCKRLSPHGVLMSVDSEVR